MSRQAFPRPARSADERSTVPDRDPDDAGRARIAEQVRDVYRQATALAAGLARSTGVHPTDADALRLLDAASGRPTMSELGDTLGLSSAAVTGLVDRLEHAGLATRERDPVDRRRVRVAVTPLAHEFAIAHLGPLMARIERAIAATGDDELAAVSAFLSRLLDESGPVEHRTGDRGSGDGGIADGGMIGR